MIMEWKFQNNNSSEYDITCSLKLSQFTKTQSWAKATAIIRFSNIYRIMTKHYEDLHIPIRSGRQLLSQKQY